MFRQVNSVFEKLCFHLYCSRLSGWRMLSIQEGSGGTVCVCSGSVHAMFRHLHLGVCSFVK